MNISIALMGIQGLRVQRFVLFWEMKEAEVGLSKSSGLQADSLTPEPVLVCNNASDRCG